MSAIRQNRMTGHGRGASRRQWVRWRVVGSGEPSEGLMPFIDSSRGARVTRPERHPPQASADARGSGFENSSLHTNSQLARLLQI
jgi:hypothetical protein